MPTKQELRKSILEKRDALTSIQRTAKSQEITERVLASVEYINANTLLLFASYKSEVDVTEIMNHALAHGKSVYFPKVNGENMQFYRIFCEAELKEGYKGIQEPEENRDMLFIPIKEEQILVLLPGVVFDTEGGRIGYGKGFYDRYLQKLEEGLSKENVCKMAVAFECQLVDKGKIIRARHDVAPDYIVTEKTCYSCVYSSSH